MQLEASFMVPDTNMAGEVSTEIDTIASAGCFMAAANKITTQLA